MAAYTMKADNIFVRCLDTVAMEVYELDSPYTFPKKGKSWGSLGISIGAGKKYEALKIGDKEINGADLQAVINDLFNSRLIVNREGLAFLSTAGVTAAVLEVEYYRVFDLFDWSNYQVTTSLRTKWARRNFMDGCPMDILGCNPKSGNGSTRDDSEYKNKLKEKEKELENEKLKHKEEMEKAAIKHKEEMEKAAIKHKEEMEKATIKHKEEIEEVKRRKEELEDRRDKINKLKEELKMKQEEVDRLKTIVHNRLQEMKEKDNKIEKLKEKLDEAERKRQVKQDEIEKLIEAERKRQVELKVKEDEIEKLKEALKEAERKKQQDMKEKQNVIEALKLALDETERKMEVELKKKQQEIAELKRKHEHALGEIENLKAENNVLENELKICFLDRNDSDVVGTMDFYHRFLEYVQTDLPPSKITIIQEFPGLYKWPPLHEPLAMVPISRVKSTSSLLAVRINCVPSHTPNDFDRNNWRVLLSAVPMPVDNPNVRRWIMAYYDGNAYHTELNLEQTVSIPLPCPIQSLVYYGALYVTNILGVGHRLTVRWGRDRQPGNGS